MHVYVTEATDTTAAVSRCYRPSGHSGPCGEVVTMAEFDEGTLYGRCGAVPPRGVLTAPCVPDAAPAPRRRYDAGLRRPWWVR